MTESEYMISTSDNPYNPFEQWDAWFAWDQRRGYHSLSLLARVVRTSSELSDADRKLAIEIGIDEIVEHNVSGKHIKVTGPSSNS